MFFKPFLNRDKTLPSLPLHRKDFQIIVGSMAGWSAVNSPDAIASLKDYVLNNWLNFEDLKKVPGSLLSYDRVPEHKMFRSMGLINRIDPRYSQYDHILIDGGVKPVIDYRLQYLDKLLRTGLKSKDITIFGGQKLRKPDDDLHGTLEEQAQSLRSNTQPWLKNWVDQELNKNSSNPDKWQRPFATEHEVSLLALLQWGGTELRHVRTVYRESPESIHESIPVADVAYEDFELHGQPIRVLNALAIRRKFIDRQLPLKESRPTGGSCFGEWLSYAKPPIGASVLLVTHNPDIYRSWLDLVIVAHNQMRQDLRLEGAGDSVRAETLYGEIIQSLGRILINFYTIHQIKSSEDVKNLR